jgi:hypothetical protein
MQPITLMQSGVIGSQGTFAEDGVTRSVITMSAQSPDAASRIDEFTGETDNGIACTVAPTRKAKPLSTSTKRLRTATNIARKQ